MFMKKKSSYDHEQKQQQQEPAFFREMSFISAIPLKDKKLREMEKMREWVSPTIDLISEPESKAAAAESIGNKFDDIFLEYAKEYDACAPSNISSFRADTFKSNLSFMTNS